MRRLILWGGFSGFLFTMAVTAADLEKGLAAVERRDWAAALAEFQPLAEQGVAEAEVNLGNLYLKGLGVPEDYGAALRWFRKAAEQGSDVAQGKLGLMYYYGFGIPEDHAEAARWFRMAAGQGEPGAASILGTLYATGDGVGEDRVQAYFWYTLASDHGNEAALQSRNALLDKMSPGEINDALGRIADWRARHEPPDAALERKARAPAEPSSVTEGKHKDGKPEKPAVAKTQERNGAGGKPGKASKVAPH